MNHANGSNPPGQNMMGMNSYRLGVDSSGNDGPNATKRMRIDAPSNYTGNSSVAPTQTMHLNPPVYQGVVTHHNQIAQPLAQTFTANNSQQMMMMQQQIPIQAQQYNASVAQFMQAQQQQTQVQAMRLAAMQQQQMNRVGGSTPTSQPSLQTHLKFLPKPTTTRSPKTMKPEATPTAVKPSATSTPVIPPSCYLCKQKTQDPVVECRGECGLNVHAKCLGERKFFQSGVGTICSNCFLMAKDRETRENLQLGGTSSISVRRAVLAINVDTSSGTNFDKFGHLASLRLYEIGEIAGYPIKPFATKFVERHLLRWIREKLCHISQWKMTIRETFTVMIGLYSLDCASIAHAWKETVLTLVQAKQYSVSDYIGWHPMIEGPQVRCSSLCPKCEIRNVVDVEQCQRCRTPLMFPSIITKFSSALLATYYADRTGIPIGVSSADVFAHFHVVRATYKGLKPLDADGHEWEQFSEQMRGIFTILDVVSQFGVLQLNPDHFAPELHFLFHQGYLNQTMLAMDFEMVGKYLQCMKLFGKATMAQYHATIEVCERFLLVQQLQQGNWCKMGGSSFEQYKSTVACAKGLLNPVFKGYGPSVLEYRRTLEKGAKKQQTYAKRLEELGNGKLLTCGVKVLAKSITNMKKLDGLYRRQIMPTSGQNTLEMLATARLRAIWPSQKQEEEPVKEEGTDHEDVGDVDSSVKQEIKKQSNGIEKTDKETILPDEDELTSLSLNGDLTLFDGLKFEDGDVIEVGMSGINEGEVPGEGEDDITEGTREDENDLEVPEGEVYEDDDDDNDNEGPATESYAPPDAEANDDGAVSMEESTDEPTLDMTFVPSSPLNLL